MLIYWLWFALHPDLTDMEKSRLLHSGLEPETVFCTGETACPEELRPLLEKLQGNRKLDEAEKVLRDCDRKGIQVITWPDDGYPYRLRHIADPPAVLYCKGSLPCVDDWPAIGVVGTRSASAYGISIARKMGREIAACGGLVVSGLALGIDAAAMEGAIEAGGRVIGVLGCGADRVYPRSNRELFEKSLRQGCILSEYPPGTPPNRWNFPRRNRIISGLSCGVLVVEAPEKSGSLITASQAAEQGRDVFVVPGNVDMPGFAGSYQLLRQGAAPVRTGWDILSEYVHLFPEKIREKPDGPVCPENPKMEEKCVPEDKKQEIKGVCDKKTIDNHPRETYIDLNDILPKLSADERAIVEALKEGERLVDDVIAETGLTAGKVLAAMTMLELKNVLSRLPGKRVALK